MTYIKGSLSKSKSKAITDVYDGIGKQLKFALEAVKNRNETVDKVFFFGGTSNIEPLRESLMAIIRKEYPKAESCTTFGKDKRLLKIDDGEAFKISVYNAVAFGALIRAMDKQPFYLPKIEYHVSALYPQFKPLENVIDTTTVCLRADNEKLSVVKFYIVNAQVRNMIAKGITRQNLVLRIDGYDDLQYQICDDVIEEIKDEYDVGFNLYIQDDSQYCCEAFICKGVNNNLTFESKIKNNIIKYISGGKKNGTRDFR